MKSKFILVLFGIARLAHASSQADQLSFEDAVTLGVQNNLDLIAAKYNIPQAEADEITAGIWNNPSVLLDTVFEPFGSTWSPNTAGGPRQFDAIFSYPFDLSGKISSARHSAHAAVSIAQASFQDAVRLKVLDIRLAYIDILTGERQLALVQEKEESLHRLVKMIEDRTGTRQILPLLLLRARQAYDQSRLDSQQRLITLKASRVQLAIQLGRSAEEGAIQPTSGLRDFSLVKLPPKTRMTDDAMSNRPDLEALKLAVSKSELDGKLAKAQVWDNFNVTAGISRQGETGSAPLTPAYSWTAGITIPLPVFNRQQGTIQKATWVGEQAQKQIASKELSIGQEIDNLSDQISLLGDLIHEYESRQLESARKVRDSQQKLFGTGSNALLDYFDAISAYQGTLSAYYDAVGDYRRNKARLDASLGKDLQP